MARLKTILLPINLVAHSPGRTIVAKTGRDTLPATADFLPDEKILAVGAHLPDVGYTDHFETTLEYALMSRAGMRCRQILASLTTNPARRFRAPHSGRVAKDMDAELVVLDADPSADSTALSKVDYTIRKGTMVYSRVR